MLIKNLICCCFLLVFAEWAKAQKAITLDDCFTSYRFYPQGAGDFQYLKDGIHYAQAATEGLRLHDVRKPDSDSLIKWSLPEQVQEFDAFDLSNDGTKVLLRTRTKQIYRHSVQADFYIYNFLNHTVMDLYEQGVEQLAQFSPDGHKVAFVSDNNLFVLDMDNGKTTQVTTDGAPEKVINGIPDWLYEEEFSPVDGDGMKALEWSPDGSKVGFLRFDETAVPEMQLTWYEAGTYPRQSAFKYPKVGQANSKVTAHMYDTRFGTTLKINTGMEGDYYLPRLYWTPDNRLAVVRMPRSQDAVEILVADGTTGQTAVLHRETDPAYVEIESKNKLIFLKNRPQFTWLSEESGFNHIYLYTMQLGKATQKTALTKGRFDVTAFYGLNEAGGKFYYQTATPTPLDRQVWEGYIDGRPPRLLTPGNGTHEATFTPSFAFYTLVRSDANTPPVVSLCDSIGRALHMVTDNSKVQQNRRDFGFVEKTFFQFRLPGDTLSLNGWMLKPAKMEAGRKYPVLIDIYGGPGSQTVKNEYDGYMDGWRQMLVQQGVIVVSVDNRGTGARGRDFKKCTQMELGKLETEDQIAAARYLASLPYVDAARIGIWGWSFGGYLSTSCILKGNDVFKMAIAVAPVVNWKWYDSAYTERYMRTMKENAGGYDHNSPIHFADRLKGGNYLICHGIADDNVHWQHSVEMINALIKANKQFDQHYYPNRNHGIYGDNATIHLFTKMTNFVKEQLLQIP
jgi:dipeptidyl-peptidase-4